MNTIDAYKRDLLHLLDASESSPTSTWDQFTDWLVMNYLPAYRQIWAPSTFNRHIAAIRGWANFMEYPILKKYKTPSVKESQPHPIDEGVVGVLRMISSTDGRNPKHSALCALTGLLGLRVSEAISVRPSNFDLNNMTLTVRGKGDKTRAVPLSRNVFKFIEKSYVDALVGNAVLVPLTQRGARFAITRHARKAGLAKPVASHDMRATFATAAYGRSGDVLAVQRLLGHANVTTTQRYTGVSVAAMRDAASVVG